MITDQILRDIEDFLVPQRKLDVWERALYYHLLRHTRLDGQESRLFSIEALALATEISDFKVREVVRSLHAKGCVLIDERSRKGHLLRVVLPREIPDLNVEVSAEPEAIDISSVDFFTGRKHVAAILRREDARCFYCLRELTLDDCVLDHVAAQAGGRDHSFRNIVASCHSCNAEKQESTGEDFLRALYRKGVLNAEELTERLASLTRLRDGLLVPVLANE